MNGDYSEHMKARTVTPRRPPVGITSALEAHVLLADRRSHPHLPFAEQVNNETGPTPRERKYSPDMSRVFLCLSALPVNTTSAVSRVVMKFAAAANPNAHSTGGTYSVDRSA